MSTLPGRSTVARYCVGACCGRTASEGFPLAAVLLVEHVSGPVAAGVVLAAARFPQAVTGPLYGALVDRSVDRRRWFVLASLAGAGSFAALALAAGWLPAAVAVVAALGVSCFEPSVTSGLSGQLSSLTRVAGSQRLYALDGVAYGAAGLLGPALVATVAAVAGVRWGMAVPLAAALAAALVLAGLPWTPTTPGPRLDLGRHLAAGARVVVGQGLRYVTVVTTVAFVGLGALPVAVTALARETGRDGAAAGIPLTVAAAGALAGSIGWARVARRTAPAQVVRACVLLTGLVLVAVAFTSSWPVIVACFGLYGLLDGPLFAATLTARDQASSVEERSAVFTTAGSLKLAAAGVGAVMAGLVVSLATPWVLFAVVAALHLPALAPPPSPPSPVCDRVRGGAAGRVTDRVGRDPPLTP